MLGAGLQAEEDIGDHDTILWDLAGWWDDKWMHTDKARGGLGVRMSETGRWSGSSEWFSGARMVLFGEGRQLENILEQMGGHGASARPCGLSHSRVHRSGGMAGGHSFIHSFNRSSPTAY